jgi:hypothetical protein
VRSGADGVASAGEEVADGEAVTSIGDAADRAIARAMAIKAIFFMSDS